MAKKLKSGSKAKGNKALVLLSVAFVALALVLTTQMVQKSQDNRSSAAVNKVYPGIRYPNNSAACTDAEGRCAEFKEVPPSGSSCSVIMTDKSVLSGGYIMDKLCPKTKDNVKCCANLDLPRKGKACGKNDDGICIDSKGRKEGDTCKVSGNDGFIAQGLCAGDSSVRCCVPTSSYVSPETKKTDTISPTTDTSKCGNNSCDSCNGSTACEKQGYCTYGTKGGAPLCYDTSKTCSDHKTIIGCGLHSSDCVWYGGKCIEPKCSDYKYNEACKTYTKCAWSSTLSKCYEGCTGDTCSSCNNSNACNDRSSHCSWQYSGTLYRCTNK